VSGPPQAGYWRWDERSWRDDSIDPRAADTLTGGVDVGSVSTQAVILAGERLYAFASMRTGASSPDSASNVMRRALEGTPLELEDLHHVVGTGYGRARVPFARRTRTEIACHARGGNYMYGPELRTLLDMGGQDCKVIRCDARGKVTAHETNDRCAAGTGRGMEVFADLLAIPIQEVGEASLDVAEEPPPVSATCVVFARSEAMALLRSGWPRNQVLAAYCSAMASQVVTLLGRIGVEPGFAITGGIAKNPGVVRRIARLLGVEPLRTEHDTQIAGALGAALFARSFARKRRQ
jgi:bzd-type benzoyl-CoA reductase Q subunit